MGKKFYISNGKKIYIKEETPKPKEGEEVEEEVEVEEEGEGSNPEEVKAQADEIVKSIMAGLGLDQVKEMQKTLENALKHTQTNDSKLTQILNGKDYVKDADKLTKEEKIVGFFHALVSKNDHATKALAEGVSADGGYLFPAEFQAELIREIAELNIMRSLVRVIPMSRNVMNIPSLVAGPQVSWTLENATKSTTTAQFGQKTLTVRKCASIMYASDELIEDSTEIDVVNTIITLFAEKLADEEERVIILGNGTTQPTGLETARSAGTIATVATSGVGDFDDIINLEYSLPAKYSNSAVYLANRTTTKNLRLLKDTQGRYLWQPSPSAGQPATLNGKPIYEVNWIPDRTVYYGDFRRGYWLGDRRRMTVKTTNDSETAFTKDQTGIRVVMRIAGNVVFGPAIKVLTGF